MYVTVEGEPLPYQTLRTMGADDVLLPGTGEAELTAAVGLCFPRADGSGLGVISRIRQLAMHLSAVVLTGSDRKSVV